MSNEEIQRSRQTGSGGPHGVKKDVEKAVMSNRPTPKPKTPKPKTPPVETR